MNLTILAKQRFKVTDEVKKWAENKFSKLDKFFKEDAVARICLLKEKNDKIRGEVTINSAGMLYRAETTHEDPLVAIDNLERTITRQLARHKTRLEKSLRDSTLAVATIDDTVEPIREEREFKIVRNKHFDVKPMSPEEAILQMNLLEHNFFLFKEAKSMRYALVYKRNAGDYGLIEI
ncbi:MAG: ribosome-associated translation inhibitor RaiA [Clostridiales bacterium]|jgi:putative sigma-54 modulation protein|nr:ribosome-associated translation inhibitor RaiA [Clostridiales bacterium]